MILMCAGKQLKMGGRITNSLFFNRYLTAVVGVAALPMSAFYSDENAHIGQKYARFAFCKTEAVLEAARAKLKNVKL